MSLSSPLCSHSRAAVFFSFVCSFSLAQSLAEGELVEFRLTTDSKTGKVKAVDVTGPDGAYVQGAPRQYDDDY